MHALAKKILFVGFTAALIVACLSKYANAQLWPPLEYDDPRMVMLGQANVNPGQFTSVSVDLETYEYGWSRLVLVFEYDPTVVQFVGVTLGVDALAVQMGAHPALTVTNMQWHFLQHPGWHRYTVELSSNASTDPTGGMPQGSRTAWEVFGHEKIVHLLNLVFEAVAIGETEIILDKRCGNVVGPWATENMFVYFPAPMNNGHGWAAGARQCLNSWFVRANDGRVTVGNGVMAGDVQGAIPTPGDDLVRGDDDDDCDDDDDDCVPITQQTWHAVKTLYQ